MAMLEEIFIKDEDNEENENKHNTQETYQEEPQMLRTHRKSKRAPVTAETKAPVQERVTEDLPPRLSWLKQNMHYIGLGMFVMALLCIVFVSYVSPACTAILDRWNYGEARISHFDLDVGHQGTSHFLAEYWHNQAIVVEFPQNHSEKATVYTLRMATTGDDDPRSVTLHTAYINPHGKPGYPDVAVQVEDFDLPAILYNTGSGFSQGQNV